jgi:hypothetical protein
MSVKVILPDHTMRDFQHVVKWLVSNLTECEHHSDFIWVGPGWRYELDPFSPAPDAHVVHFAECVDPELITQFKLTWC